MARVLVSLTVVAAPKVLLPWIPSHAAAAAVTEEVSFTAVPAKRPNPWSLNPRRPPRLGKMRAAATLKRKITDMEVAISSSFASMTGAAAAMAEPPQMEEPTPIRVVILEESLMALYMKKATRRETVIVERMIGKDCLPVFTMLSRFMLKPRRTTAY